MIAFYPLRRGFGFAVAKQPVGLCDWGWVELASKNLDECIVRVDALIARHAAFYLVLEDLTETRRSTRFSDSFRHWASTAINVDWGCIAFRVRIGKTR